MLSLTRIEEGQQTLDLQPVHLQELCQDLYDMAEVLADDKQQTLTIDVKDDEVLMGDKYLLFQALFNLVDNAIKYAPEGSKIDIVQRGKTIEIADNGPVLLTKIKIAYLTV